jgi:hypothetical protein
MANKPLSPRNIEREAFPIPAIDFDLDQVRSAVRGIRYGEVRVVIQDGLIVQIDRLEKQRIR